MNYKIFWKTLFKTSASEYKLNVHWHYIQKQKFQLFRQI